MSTPDVAAMRRSYERGGLSEADLAPTWLAQLQAWLADAVAAGLAEPNAMVLATADAHGVPSARTVLLKALDERGLAFFTNGRSRKGRELAANPRAALVLPWIDLQRQVTVAGPVEPLEAAESDAYFASRPRGSRLGAIASPQSQVVADRAELEKRRAQAEADHPGDEPVGRPPHWGGFRVLPERVEFWQGRPDRMHDRLVFRHDGGGWVVERLAP